MDQLNNAVASYVKQVEEAIDSGLSYKQFIRVTQRVEASVLLHLGDSALDHFVHKKFRDELTMHTVRLYDECKRRYSGRCWSAQQEIFEGSDDVRNGVFHNVTKYTTDPLCVENDWDIWCEKYLISCGQTMEDLEEESKVLLNVFKKSATHLVVSVKADCQQQVDLFKKALAKTNEHLDQSSLDIIKLQGEKENGTAICRSLESRNAELQTQQATQAAIIRDLKNKLSTSALEVKASKEDAETTSMKYEKLVARLVAKTKEASALAGEKRLLLEGNEALKRTHQRLEDQGVKKNKRGGQGGSEEALLRELTVNYSKQVMELQESLDSVTNQLEYARDSGICAEKLMLGDQEKMTQLSLTLDNTAQSLNKAEAECARLEGKLNTKEEECMSMVKTLQRTQDSHKTQLTHLRQQFGDREQELVSQVTLLSNQILKSREEQLVYVGHLEQAHAEARRLGSALSLAEAKADAATTANISEENLGDTTSLRQELLQAKQDLEIMREKMHSEEVTNKQKVTTTLQVAQNRINELDMAYFRVEAELNIKTSEAKKYYSKVRQLEEEASAQDRLRRKAELKLDEEIQKRNMTDKTMAAMEAEVETMKETLRTNRASLDEAQRQLEIMKFTQEAAEEDMTILLEKNSSLKVAMEKLRCTVGCVNDLEYELSEMSKAKALRESEIAVLEGEISVLMPLKEEVACLQKKVRELEVLLAEAEAAKKAVAEKDARCTDIISQFDDLTKTNSVLLEETTELEDQVETLSLAFAQRGELLKDLERRLDVSTSDAAYLRSDNAKAREQVRELGEKVQTLMINYNEASSQNEEKGFALLQLNGQQHELQSNLSKIAGELAVLRDLPAKISQLQDDHTAAKKQLAETLATLDELSLLSASDLQEKDTALAELTQKFTTLSEENKVMSKEYEELVVIHKELEEDREALFVAYSALNNKLSDIESEIME